MVGIDLHSNNLFCGITDVQGRRLWDKKLPCELGGVLNALQPYRERIDTVAVESTFNWYWLVDGLQDHGYQVVLANPAAIVQYEGLKYTDDQSDCFFLAELLRLKILPLGHICDRKIRSVRDLLRRRMGLVHQRTALMLSLKSHHARLLGQPLATGRVKAMTPSEGAELFSDSADRLVAEVQLRLMRQFDQEIDTIEKTVRARASGMPCYHLLQSLPGVGKILALTITLETAGIERFADAGHYASYCRCVDSKRVSNQKKKGSNNVRNGNAYLAWAWVEAANFARRFDEPCRRFHDRKTAQVNAIVATKALACKLAKAAWHIMSQNLPYNPQQMFPQKSICCLGRGDKKPLDNAAQPHLSPGQNHLP